MKGVSGVVEIRVWSWLLLLCQVTMAAMDWIISSRTGNIREDPSSDRLVRVTTKTGSGYYDGIDGIDSDWVIEVIQKVVCIVLYADGF